MVFSGDIGRYDQPILNDPVTPPSKAMTCCSANRRMATGSTRRATRRSCWREIVNRVVKRGGSIVIPAFAIGRTQTFMYYLRQLEDQQRIPRLPVYVDSPMALSATDLYLKHKEDHDLEFARDEQNGKGDPLNVHEFHLTRIGGGIEGHQQREDAVHHYFGERDGDGRPRAAPLGAEAPDARNCRYLGGISGRRNARAGPARRREDAESLRAAGAGLAEIVEMGQFSRTPGKASCCDG